MCAKLTIAFLQLLPAGSLEGNMKKGIKACRQAKEKGADIALFPEMWSCGYAFPHDETGLRECAVPCDSLFIKKFSELAAELDMAIAITLLEQHEPKPRNTVCLFDRHGKLQCRYSKVHICDFGRADDEGVLDAGDTFFVADLDTKNGVVRVGSMICYDREFPESARILMLKGAELLLVPNACPMELNRLAQLRGRAFENMLAIATCNYPAPHPDCNGHSTLFDGIVYLPGLPGSRDTCVFEADESEGVYTTELNIDMLRSYRRREVWGPENRRPELYKEISMDKIRSFKGKYFFLSNFYPVKVMYKCVTYKSSEAAFQAQKTTDGNIRDGIATLDASDAKRVGRRVVLRPDWEEIKDHEMEEIVRAKFEQNKDLRKKLVDTKDAVLVEGNTWNDRYWGVDEKTGEGQNHLGKILMKIRSEMQKQDNQQ